MSRREVLVAFFATLLALGVGCSPRDQAGSKASPSEHVAASDRSALPWYGDMLKNLGFFVFPEPVALQPFKVLGINNVALSSADLSGTITLLNFWATWCPPCKQEMPSIERLYSTMNGSAFRIVAISDGESRAVVEDFLKKTPYSFPIYLDESGEVSAAYVSRGIPTTFIVNKEGKVIAGVIGAMEYDTPAMIAAFKELASR